MRYLMNEEMVTVFCQQNRRKEIKMKKIVQAILIVTMLCATSVAAMAAAATTTSATTTASTCTAPKVLLSGSCVACPAGAEYRLGKDEKGNVNQVQCVTKASCPAGTTFDAGGGCISATTPCPAGAVSVIMGNVCTVPATVTKPACQTGGRDVNGECVSCPDPSTQQLVVSGSIAKCAKVVTGVAATCTEGNLYNGNCISCPAGTTFSLGLCIVAAAKTAQVTCPAGATLNKGPNGLTCIPSCPAGMTAVSASSTSTSTTTTTSANLGGVRCEFSPNILSKATCSTGTTLSNGKCVQTCPAGMSPVETAGVFSCQSTATSCPAGTTFAGLRCITTACPQSTTQSGNECLVAASKQ